jgi:hypothetical protein
LNAGQFAGSNQIANRLGVCVKKLGSRLTWNQGGQVPNHAIKIRIFHAERGSASVRCRAETRKYFFSAIWRVAAKIQGYR